MKKYLIIFCICLTLLISGCNNSKEIENNTDNVTNSAIITGKEAKEKVDEGAIVVDVRTQEEYNAGHIDGAILFPVDEINSKSVLNYLPDTNAQIIVYCRSGNRSNQALQKLKDLGYKNVYDLGSIDNWEE